MKQTYILTSLLCLTTLLMPGCTSPIGSGDDLSSSTLAINFGTPQADTRAAVNSSTNMGEFSVWGWYGKDGTNSYNVFNNETVSRSDNSWDYTGGTRYWIPGYEYNFYGVYPVKIGSCTANGLITVNTFDCSNFGEDAVDLMTATATGDGNNPQPVAMEFKHLLAKVNIVATVEGGNCTVTSATFSGMAIKGNYNSSAGWTDTTTGSFTNSESKVLNTTGIDLLGDLLLIPQTVTDEFKIKVNYTLDGKEQTPKEITLPTSINQWNAGQSYKYTLTFKGNNIIFTVNVASWGHSTGGIITVE